MVIEATNITPAVYYGEDNKLMIKGRSIIDDVIKFYQPLIDWAGMLTVDTLTVEIDIDFMNSASSKKMLNLLKVLDANNKIKKLNINWRYEEDDEDALEQGQIFEELLFRPIFRYYSYK